MMQTYPFHCPHHFPALILSHLIEQKPTLKPHGL
jgi:hypothetical protein